MKKATVRITSMNPRLFGEIIFMIFSGSISARDKPNTNFRILTPRAFTWTHQIFTLTKSTGDIGQNMILSHLFDLLKKIFWLLKNFEIFFSPKYFLFGSSLNSCRDLSTLVPKTATRDLDSFSIFSPNIELTLDLLKLQPKSNFFITYIQ